MNWEGRLRDMMVAGGSVVVAACSSGAVVSGASDSGPEDASVGPDVNFCCNANGDPCCGYLHCGGPLTPACSSELACQDAGGMYNPYSITDVDGNVTPASCSVSSDAGPADAPLDSAPDPFDVACCNASSDPCCVYLHCGASITLECSAELACQADGGTYDRTYVTQPDGSFAPGGCSLAHEAGPADANPDSEPPEAGGG